MLLTTFSLSLLTFLKIFFLIQFRTTCFATITDSSLFGIRNINVIVWKTSCSQLKDFCNSLPLFELLKGKGMKEDLR